MTRSQYQAASRKAQQEAKRQFNDAIYDAAKRAARGSRNVQVRRSGSTIKITYKI